MKYAIRSHIGRRAHNEDRACVPKQAEGMQFVAVSDGMGGHAAGETASTMTVNGMLEELRHSFAEDPLAALQRAVAHVNLDVYRAAQDDPALHGMGATLVCALLSGSRFRVANVGDSRLYHFDGDTLTQVTTDHSLVEMLVRSGKITREQARAHPRRNIITRAIGIGLRVEADLFDRSWKRGDILLLCSDGLIGCLEDARLAEILRSGGTLDEMADRLVQEALDSGESDNITVVLARCEGGACA